MATVNMPEGQVYAGVWPDESSAAIARDRVVLYFELDRPLNLPWASRLQGPASPEELRAQVRTNAPKSSEYLGVSRMGPRWQAFVLVDGDVVTLGRWPDEKAAAVARDRAVLYFELDAELNLPGSSRRLGAASVDELRREARLATRPSKFASEYFGVSKGAKGRWEARIWLGHRRGQKTTYIATFDTEENAAIAHDRVARRLRPDAALNFPERRYRPASIDEMQAWSRKVNEPPRGRAGKRSRYYGVIARGDGWVAQLNAMVGDVKQSLYLGTWRSERAAALARDRAVLYYGCKRAILNFPAKAAELVPLDADSLSAEATRARARSPK
jgi:hypothetical protein